MNPIEITITPTNPDTARRQTWHIEIAEIGDRWAWIIQERRIWGSRLRAQRIALKIAERHRTRTAKAAAIAAATTRETIAAPATASLMRKP